MKSNILYIHGFASSPNSRTVRLLELALSEYNIIAPEVSSDVQDSINYINKVINNKEIDLIIGTSLGGFYALSCNNIGIPVVVVNPAVNPTQDLRQFLGENKYLNPRKDKAVSFEFKEYDLNKFRRYEAKLDDKIELNKNLIWAILSNRDETIKKSNDEFFKKRLKERHIIITDEIGHRLEDDYILHDLRDLIINILENDEYRNPELEQDIVYESLNEMEAGPLFESFKTLWPDDEEMKLKYINEIWDDLQRAYSYIGGFATAKTKEELLRKADIWKLCFKNGKLVAFSLYKDTKFGRKSICGATDNTELGKVWFQKIIEEDIREKDRAVYTEVSGKMEHYFRKYNAPLISYELVKQILLGKDIDQEIDIEDEKNQLYDFDKDYHYYRVLKDGNRHRKIMVGNLKRFNRIPLESYKH